MEKKVLFCEKNNLLLVYDKEYKLIIDKLKIIIDGRIERGTEV